MTGLEKITALLKQMGISEETTSEFAKILNEWSDSEKNRYRDDFAKRITEAKKACIEEVESHKASVSRGVQKFLESKVKEIERAGAKQRAIEESEATNTLKHVKSLLEGINVDEAANSQALQSEKKANASLKAELVSIRENLNREKAKSAKFSDMAEKSLERQKILESKLGDRSAQATTLAKIENIQESKTETSETKKVVTEVVKAITPVTPVVENVSKPKTLAEAKAKPTQPVTTFSKPKEATAKPQANGDIDAIANSI
jgi:hypothetical protein